MEVRELDQMSAWSFLQHSRQAGHQVAMHLYLRPQLPLESAIGDTDVSAALSRIRHGSLPPPEHWLRVWRFVKTPTSLRGAEAILGTEAFLAHLRTGQGLEETKRKQIKKSILCMAEVIRARTRAALLEAHSITLALDDRGPYRVIRYRCDVIAGCTTQAAVSPSRETERGLSQTVTYRDGILGVHCTAARKDSSLEDLDDDYSERMRDSVVTAVEQLFSGDVPGEIDTTNVQRVLGKVHTFLGDGASSVQKCGALLRAGRCRNIALILRDPVHAMRTSTSEPLKSLDNFRRFWEDVFANKHALVPDVQNSDAWRRRLVLAQQHILKASGKQGGGVTTALRHLSFAKQRFDSATGPARKFCCLLSAITILLVTVAADRRLKPEQRLRAQTLIDDMTPARIVTAGLFADYMAECTRFFRHFEKTDHDIALSRDQKHQFKKRLRTLFVDGFLIAERRDDAEACVACPAEDETCTEIAVSQAISFGTIHYADRSVTLWPAGAKGAAEVAVAEMGQVVDACLARVEVEMPDTDLVCAFASST